MNQIANDSIIYAKHKRQRLPRNENMNAVFKKVNQLEGDFRKPFNKQLFEENNTRAVEMTKKIWKKLYNVQLTENSDLYGIDLVSPTESVECEIRNSWRSGEFPFEDFKIANRKLKHLQNGHTIITYNDTMTHAIIVRPHLLKNSTIEYAANKYSGNKLEAFVTFSVDDVEQIEVGNV